MSRFNIEAKKPGYSIAVGLDDPLQCWFFQLWSPADKDAPEMEINTQSHYTIGELLKEHAKLERDTDKKIYIAIMLDVDPADYHELQQA